MINKIVLIGRLTADPELRYTNNGTAVASFSIAVDRAYRNQQGERETDFINIVVWRKLAELCNEYLHKGRMAAVEGRLQMRRYKNKDGENRTVYEVVADDVNFLGSPKDSGGSAPPPGRDDAPPVSYEPDEGSPLSDTSKMDDDLPF